MTKKNFKSQYELINKKEKKIKGKEADKKIKPDWSKKCEVCGNSPIVPMTGMCGPCTFGESETAGGNW